MTEKISKDPAHIMSPTRRTLSEKDTSELKNEIGKLSVRMCEITEYTKSAQKGCNLSEELVDYVSDLPSSINDSYVLQSIRSMLDDIDDISTGIEVSAEEILEPTKKTRRHYYKAKKLIVSPISQ